MLHLYFLSLPSKPYITVKGVHLSIPIESFVNIIINFLWVINSNNGYYYKKDCVYMKDNDT